MSAGDAKRSPSSSQMSEIDPSQALDIEFRNLKFTVPGKEILKGIDGFVRPGRILAILGSSGAGKTTLLDILAENPTPGGKIEGEVLVNGAPRDPVSFRRSTCYVLQRDVLQASATVKESITTSALLKLPMTMTHKEKMARVDVVLEELGLTDCANTLIGDELLGIKGISGGQRRRVSIGIELIKQPRAIFLDEPTSGLDSEMAIQIMDTLQNLAAMNRTIALTIHQPNSLITNKFSDFMLLAFGELVYFGEWKEAVPFFASAGLHCPEYMNPTDFFLREITTAGPAVDALVEQQRRKGISWLKSNAVMDYNQDIDNVDTDAPSVVKPSAGANLETTAGAAGQRDILQDVQQSPNVPGWYQCYVLIQRNIRDYYRNPLMLFSELSQYLFMGLFVGLMYLQLNNSVETGVSDRLASIWFGMAVLSFTPSYTAVTTWDRGRILLRREAGQAMYSVTSYFAARTLTVIPIQILQTLLFGFIAFFMVGYAITLTNILIYLTGYCLFMIVSEAVGVMAATVTKNSTSAILVLTFVLLLLLSFSGFLVSDVPVYFKWIRYISYLTYAYDAIVASEFDHTTFVCNSGPPACPVQGQYIPGYELIPNNVNNGLAPGYNLLILLGITVVTRIMCFAALFGAYHFHYL